MASSKAFIFTTGLLVGIISGGSGGYYFATHNAALSLFDKAAPTPSHIQTARVREPAPVKLPDPTQAKVLITTTMNRFATAILQGDMKGFYQSLSRLWQSKTNPKKLAKSFQPFLQAKVDLRPLKRVQPILIRGPHRLKNGDLLIEGYYPTRPNRVYFRQIFHLENGTWKLSAFYIQLKKAPG